MQVKPIGGTPLAEIYKILQPSISAFKPDIFVTLTDGEPVRYGCGTFDSVVIQKKWCRNDCHRFGLGFRRCNRNWT